MTTMPDHVTAYTKATGQNCELQENTTNMLPGVSWWANHAELRWHPVPDPDSAQYLADVLKGLEKRCCHLHIMSRNDPGRGFEWEVGIASDRDIVMGTGYGPTWKAALIAAVLKAKEAQA